jgi:hypothetical protein
MGVYTSEPMNPGSILTIRSNLPTSLLSFIFSMLIKYENTKILLLLVNTNKNTKGPSYYCFFCIAFLVIDCSTLFYLQVLLVLVIWNLVLDNDTVELGTKGNYFVLKVEAKHNSKPILWVFDINPKSPLWGKDVCYNTLHLVSQWVGTHGVVAISGTWRRRTP